MVVALDWNAVHLHFRCATVLLPSSYFIWDVCGPNIATYAPNSQKKTMNRIVKLEVGNRKWEITIGPCFPPISSIDRTSNGVNPEKTIDHGPPNYGP